MGRPKKVIEPENSATKEEKTTCDVYKMTFFKTKNGKEWMPGERYKVVISPTSERVKTPKGFTKINEWTDTFIVSESNYDFTEDMKSGYLTFQGNIGYFPPTNFIYPKVEETLQ